MNVFVLTLFPEALAPFFLKGIFKKAHTKNLFNISFINIRDFAYNKHRKVDDYTFGMMDGMLLKPDVLLEAIKSIEHYERYRIIYPCPKGRVFTQEIANEYQHAEGLIFICGYYEGIDERLLTLFNIERISIGDFVLSSGELPSLIIIESVLRLIPGVIGKQASIVNDSIVSGLLEHPHYTFPRNFLGNEVPEVIVSGHHGKISHWQKQASLKTTLYNRPDLLAGYSITPDEKAILTTILKEE